MHVKSNLAFFFFALFFPFFFSMTAICFILFFVIFSVFLFFTFFLLLLPLFGTGFQFLLSNYYFLSSVKKFVLEQTGRIWTFLVHSTFTNLANIYRLRYSTTDSRVVKSGSSSFFPGLLHWEVSRLSMAFAAVKYSTVWLRNLVLFLWTLAFIHLAIAYSSLDGLTTGCKSSISCEVNWI